MAYDIYIDKVVECFNNKHEILGSDLKKAIGMEGLKNQWGSLLSSFIARKILIKIDDKFEKINSKPVYYYRLSPDFKRDKEKEEKQYLIIDQYGNHYDYNSDKKIEEEVNSLLKSNTSLVISVYKKIQDFKAEINVVSKNY